MWWNKNLVKYQKVSKYYENDCRWCKVSANPFLSATNDGVSGISLLSWVLVEFSWLLFSLVQQHPYLRHDTDSNVGLVSGWKACCSEMHWHPTCLAGCNPNSCAAFYQYSFLLNEAHPVYHAKFLSLVDPGGVAYTFAKIMGVLFRQNKHNKLRKKFQNLYLHHQCRTMWHFYGRTSHPQTMHLLRLLANFFAIPSPSSSSLP